MLEIAVALAAALGLGWWLGRLRRRRREPVEELGGFLAGAVPVAFADRDEELDLEEGALDPESSKATRSTGTRASTTSSAEPARRTGRARSPTASAGSSAR
jgi:hypothetical protein